MNSFIFLKKFFILDLIEVLYIKYFVNEFKLLLLKYLVILGNYFNICWFKIDF